MDSYLYLAPLHSLEAVQRDAEQGWSEQENLNDEFSEEIANVVAALNNSFSNWKELQVVAQCSLPMSLTKTFSRANIGCMNTSLQAGHTDVANKTMQILAALEQVEAAILYLKTNVDSS